MTADDFGAWPEPRSVRVTGTSIFRPRDDQIDQSDQLLDDVGESAWVSQPPGGWSQEASRKRVEAREEWRKATCEQLRDALATLGNEEDNPRLVELPSGMVRGDNAGKTDYLLVRDGPLYERWAKHLSAHASEKGKRNWTKADRAEDLERFRESLLRHVEQYLRGDDDEDHAAAILFNLNGAEYVAEALGMRNSDR